MRKNFRVCWFTSKLNGRIYTIMVDFWMFNIWNSMYIQFSHVTIEWIWDVRMRGEQMIPNYNGCSHLKWNNPDNNYHWRSKHGTSNSNKRKIYENTYTQRDTLIWFWRTSWWKKCRIKCIQFLKLFSLNIRRLHYWWIVVRKFGFIVHQLDAWD